MQLIGVYEVENYDNVYLVELTLNEPPEKLDVGQITQEINGMDKSEWQSPWDEKYLDPTGENVIGEFFDVPKGQKTTRITFFFHELNLQLPLLTQYGPVSLTAPVTMPDRLKEIIIYESPD